MNMKKCNHGHFYSDSFSTCPYCSNEDIKPSQNLNQTIIIPPINREVQKDNTTPPKNNPHPNGRKLVGWLVTFSHQPLGQDFKLYEGKNTIGSDASCDIVIPDKLISAKHLTILHRAGTFKFKDEFSTNGTFVNEVMKEEGELKDGDQIRLGKTIFKFKSIE